MDLLVTSGRMIACWLQVIHDTGVPSIYYREDTNDLFGSFRHTFVLHTSSRSNFHSLQVDGSLLLQISSFICIFLFTGMHVWPIFGARLLRSLWNFHHWIPGKKSHSLDYSLGIFGAVGPEVIFHCGF